MLIGILCIIMFYVQFMRFPVLDLRLVHYCSKPFNYGSIYDTFKLCDILASYKCVEANSEYTSYDIVVITYT